MMSPELSPAPSEVPVNKDGSGGNDHSDETGLNLESDVMTNVEGTESEESSEEYEVESADENLYSGYVALEQQPLDEGDSAEGEMSWVQQYQLSSNCENQPDTYTDGEINDAESNQNDADPPDISSQAQERHLPASSVSIQITDAHAEVIKQAMSGFSLPTNNIPEWARVVPEENWKSKLMDSIAKKH